MLEYTGAGDGARLMMLVLHDDAKREYACGPAQGMRDTKVGAFTQKLYDEAKKKGWTVISMKDDWKKIFAFEGRVHDRPDRAGVLKGRGEMKLQRWMLRITAAFGVAFGAASTMMATDADREAQYPPHSAA